MCLCLNVSMFEMSCYLSLACYIIQVKIALRGVNVKHSPKKST